MSVACNLSQLGFQHDCVKHSCFVSQKKVSNAGGSAKDANGERREKSDLKPSVQRSAGPH